MVGSVLLNAITHSITGCVLAHTMDKVLHEVFIHFGPLSAPDITFPSKNVTRLNRHADGTAVQGFVLVRRAVEPDKGRIVWAHLKRRVEHGGSHGT